MLTALLLQATSVELPHANAVKNALLGLANGVAAVVYIVLGKVEWAAAAPLTLGLMLAGWLGPAVVRRAPGACYVSVSQPQASFLRSTWRQADERRPERSLWDVGEGWTCLWDCRSCV
jgi:hypothetical protein